MEGAAVRASVAFSDRGPLTVRVRATKPQACCGVRYAQAAGGQEALVKKVGMLETHQREIHDALASMEAEATRLYQACALAPQNAPASHAHALSLLAPGPTTQEQDFRCWHVRLH